MNDLHDTPSYISKQVELSRLFFLDSDKDEPFAVPCGGFERCRKDYRIDRSGLPWYCMEYVNRGSGWLEIEGKRHELRAGSYYIYRPGMKHRIESSQDDPLSKYFVGFQGHEVEEFINQYRIEVGAVAYCHKGDSVRRGFDMLIDRGLRKSALAKPICSLITRELLLLCQEDSAGPVDTDSPAYGTYMRARDYIESGFMRLSSLDAVAKGCGVEAAYLCRLFSRYHDESPYQYLTRLRMDHASRLLLEEHATVRSVAKSIGYKDPFHFSRVFKSVHRVPPSKFRSSIYA